MHTRRGLLSLAGAFTCLLWTLPAIAQTAISPVPVAAEPGNTAPGADETGAMSAEPSPAAPSGFWERATLLGEMGGLRTLLGNSGITLGLTETSEVLGNVTGGLRRGAAYDGLITLTLSLDTHFQWPGGTFNISALQIHGRNLSADNLAALQTVSGIEAARATRLWEIWF
jgi:porin